ncbi:hypothetical protein NliqN6_5679 [Naganishia liquefaciens]|uniref:Uncharacterized protein n=1 Tax=Naganishia liquefaciens TaxID=104408 RepID=A0A8H3YIK1_9TREE|nr:hypothetical protein NliqN6_5679 [Naganishia liquefaciens]
MAVPASSSLPDATLPELIEEPREPPREKAGIQFAGFAAGIASGWTKLIVGHPPDLIKTRMQTAAPGVYKGAWDCLAKTVSQEGLRKLYAGASAPAVGWTITDAILMGTLHNYRAFLLKNGFDERDPTKPGQDARRLSLLGQSIAGMWAGWSNALPAHFIEKIKCTLQVQAARDSQVGVAPSPSKVADVRQLRAYSTVAIPSSVAMERFTGPFDVIKQTVQVQGVTGMWRGFGVSLVYRSSFAAMFGGNRMFQKLKGTPYELSQDAANFLAGGLASNLYWLSALPADNVKSRIMTDSLARPRYRNAWHVVRVVFHEKDLPSRSRLGNTLAGMGNFYRGIVPVVLRAFPTNAAALAVWEAVMRAAGEKE